MPLPKDYHLSCHVCRSTVKCERGYDYLDESGAFVRLGSAAWTRVLDDMGIGLGDDLTGRLFRGTDFACRRCGEVTRHRRLCVPRQSLLQSLLKGWHRLDGPEQPTACGYCGGNDLWTVDDAINDAGLRRAPDNKLTTLAPIRLRCRTCGDRTLELGLAYSPTTWHSTWLRG